MRDANQGEVVALVGPDDPSVPDALAFVDPNREVAVGDAEHDDVVRGQQVRVAALDPGDPGSAFVERCRHGEDALAHAGGQRRAGQLRLELPAADAPDPRREHGVRPPLLCQVAPHRSELALQRGHIVMPLVPLVLVGPGSAGDGCHEQEDDGDAHQIRPERKTPHISQSPSSPAMKNPYADTTFSPSTCGPEVAKTPIRLEPISPAATTKAMISRLNATSILCMNSSSPLCTNPTSIWPSRACSRTSWIWYGYSAKIDASLNDSRRARDSTRCGV